MVKILYRSGAEILSTQTEAELAAISRENVLWIDMLQPTGEQKRFVEQYLGVPFVVAAADYYMVEEAEGG